MGSRRIHLDGGTAPSAAIIHDALQAAKLVARSAETDKPLMPNCTRCGEFDKVQHSKFPEEGSHWCEHCFDAGEPTGFFTPVNESQPKLGQDSDHMYRILDTATGKEYFGKDKADAEAKVVTSDPKAEAYAEFRKLFECYFPSLSFEFIETMNDIGKLGRDKYGDDCIEARVKRGDTTRFPERILRREIAKHAANHFQEYIDGIKHDVYRTGRHQLAAAAFNPMMEFMLSQLEKEGIN